MHESNDDIDQAHALAKTPLQRIPAITPVRQTGHLCDCSANNIAGMHSGQYRVQVVRQLNASVHHEAQASRGSLQAVAQELEALGG